MINIPSSQHERIVVVGGGFAGIELVQQLSHTPYQIVLLDQNNYFTFQPLLYQVATAGLEPHSVAYPFRRMFRKADNVFFRMTTVEAVDPNSQTLHTSIGELSYDYLVLAMGGTPNYFGLPANKLLTLKSLEGASQMKNTILRTFEAALEADSEEERDAYLNIVIAGGGPTGVELAGALGEMKKFVLPKDYPQLDFSELKIILLEGQDRLLPGMSQEASSKAKVFLEQLGVEVRLNELVNDYQDNQVVLAERRIPSYNLIWTAGIKANTLAGLEEVPTHGAGRLKVDSFNRLLGFRRHYAIGDVAAMITPETPEGHPNLAPVALQQAQQLARNFLRALKGKEPHPFTYFDKGTMATIGRNRAVVDTSWFKMQGTLAWFAWMFVHLVSLVGFRNKLVTLIDWSYNYFTYDRALRLIRKESPQEVAETIEQ